MIRRDIRLVDGKPCWLLVSQIEHARISGVLTEHCIDKFGKSSSADGLSSVREELLAAIVRHDDGWAAWEDHPRLDAEHGRPPSFREMPLAESLPIWSASIEVAEDLGDLAAWAVAGHFAALLEASESIDDDEAIAWRRDVARRRQAWHAQWRAADPRLHTAALAREALEWLQVFDVMSLWLCSVCPAGGEEVTDWPESYAIGENTELAARLSPTLPVGDPRDAPDAQLGRALIDPWPFSTGELSIDADGHVAPIRKYTNIADLTAARTPHRLRWLLRPSHPEESADK